MNELSVQDFQGQPVIDSRDVAQMVGKQHGHLMRDINGYAKIMQESTESKIGVSDFFIQSNYKDSTGRSLPCYLLTKKGCDMVANKMTGEKGVLFTAAYVTAFEKMREQIAQETGLTSYQERMAETRRDDLAVQKARLLNQIASEYSGTYRQILQAYATKELTGEFLLPLPKLEQRTYSAGEIGQLLGISANRVGTLTNRHHLKTEEYGAWFNDKAKGHGKEVQTFRYYETVIPVLKKLLESTT